jgi:PhzF family phenazine biosynthesis protein
MRPEPWYLLPMKKLAIYEVNAFTDTPFKGNPAAVCPLEEWLPDALMQSIAAELNLSETAFFVRREDGDFDLRWFTPAVEIKLCGHATLASAFVLFHHRSEQRERIIFHSKSGPLYVSRFEDKLELNFPANVPQPKEVTPALIEALGAAPREAWQARDTVVLFDSAEEVRALRPDIAKVKALDTYGVIATARGTGVDQGVDFVSRFFVPRAGIAEDPVTGSAHCELVPLWAQRLQKNALRARQVSQRSGELWCQLEHDRVKMAGHAVLVWEGNLYL